MNYKVDPIPRHELDDTLREYVCSICWGALEFHQDRETHEWYALCRRHKEETVGYTSRKFAERKREASIGELLEAERNLRDLMGLKRERRTTGENLKELGF